MSVLTGGYNHFSHRFLLRINHGCTSGLNCISSMQASPLRCRDAGNFNKGVAAVTMEGQHTAPPCPQFRHVTDKLHKAPDNSWYSSTRPSLHFIGPAGRLRGYLSWGVDAVYHVRILDGIYLSVPEMHVEDICANVLNQPELSYAQAISARLDTRCSTRLARMLYHCHRAPRSIGNRSIGYAQKKLRPLRDAQRNLTDPPRSAVMVRLAIFHLVREFAGDTSYQDGSKSDAQMMPRMVHINPHAYGDLSVSVAFRSGPIGVCFSPSSCRVALVHRETIYQTLNKSVLENECKKHMQ